MYNCSWQIIIALCLYRFSYHVAAGCACTCCATTVCKEKRRRCATALFAWKQRPTTSTCTLIRTAATTDECTMLQRMASLLAAQLQQMVQGMFPAALRSKTCASKSFAAPGLRVAHAWCVSGACVPPPAFEASASWGRSHPDSAHPQLLSPFVSCSDDDVQCSLLVAAEAPSLDLHMQASLVSGLRHQQHLWSDWNGAWYAINKTYLFYSLYTYSVWSLLCAGWGYGWSIFLGWLWLLLICWAILN